MSWNWPVLAVEHWIPITRLHPCPVQQCQHLLQGRPIDSARETDRKRLMAALASGGRERNWRVSGVPRGGGGGGRLTFRPAHLWMQGKAVCVVCPRDNSAATPHACLRGKGGKPPPFFSSFEKQPYLVAWCCCHGAGLFWKGEREQKLWLAVKVIGNDAIISHLFLSLAAFLLLSLGH